MDSSLSKRKIQKVLFGNVLLFRLPKMGKCWRTSRIRLFAACKLSKAMTTDSGANIVAAFRIVEILHISALAVLVTI